MGSLRYLSDNSKNVHLLLTTSNKAELYVYDELKSMCGATRESIYEIESKKDFIEMLELVGMQPYLSLKWLFVVNYSKLKGMCKKYASLFSSETSLFLVKVKNYGEYKEFKELVPFCNDIYLSYMRANEIYFVFNGFDLSEKVAKFIASSYGNDAEKIFELREKLIQGLVLEKPKDVVKAVGSSGSSIAKFALMLLNNPPKTEKGFTKVYKNRVQMSKELLDTYSPMTIRNFLLASVKDILDIKILYSQGVIFKNIKNLPDCYDEKRLSRYNFCLERIEMEIPISRILKLYCLLQSCGTWHTEGDMLEFIYEYYGGL